MYDYYVRLASSHVRVPILHWGAFLNAVGVSLEYSLKYEDAVELYQESIKVLQGTPRLEVFARPIINEVAIKLCCMGQRPFWKARNAWKFDTHPIQCRTTRLLANATYQSARIHVQRNTAEIHQGTRRNYQSSTVLHIQAQRLHDTGRALYQRAGLQFG